MTMDYEKAYKEAMDRARAGKPMNEVFPELHESEDEITRKEIIDYLKFAESHNLLRAVEYQKTKGWIARDHDGGLYLYFNKPWQTLNGYTCRHDLFIRLDRHLFPDVQWKDDPIEVELTINKGSTIV